MPNKPVSSAVGVIDPAVAEPESKSKTTYTKWDTFDKAGLVPEWIKTWPYPGQPDEHSSKTKIVPVAKNVVQHIKNADDSAGVGFMFKLRQATGGKTWPGWKELQDAGVEIQLLRSEVTDRSVSISVRELQSHIRPHRGKFRGAYQAFQGQFLFQLSFGIPPAVGDDEYDFPPIEDHE